MKKTILLTILALPLAVSAQMTDEEIRNWKVSEEWRSEMRGATKALTQQILIDAKLHKVCPFADARCGLANIKAQMEYVIRHPISDAHSSSEAERLGALAGRLCAAQCGTYLAEFVETAGEYDDKLEPCGLAAFDEYVATIDWEK